MRLSFTPNKNKPLVISISLKQVISYRGCVGVALILALQSVVLMEIQHHQYVSISNFSNQTQLLEQNSLFSVVSSAEQRFLPAKNSWIISELNLTTSRPSSTSIKAATEMI